MCELPGGKTIFFNIHRMNIKNSIITNYDTREFAKLYNKFDRVLLDVFLCLRKTESFIINNIIWDI